jgi:hypothetical protein
MQLERAVGYALSEEVERELPASVVVPEQQEQLRGKGDDATGPRFLVAAP